MDKFDHCILCGSDEIEIINLRETTGRDSILFRCSTCGQYAISHVLARGIQTRENGTAPTYLTPTQQAITYIFEHREQLSRAAQNWDYAANKDECMILSSSVKAIRHILNQAETE